MYKTRSHNLLFVVAILNLLTGCQKWLDVKPDISIGTPNNLKDLQLLMDNTGQMNTGWPFLGELSTDYNILTNDFLQTTNSSQFINAFTWSHQLPYTNVTDWGGTSYSRILTCNVVLESLKKISPSDAQEQIQWNNIYGQALFIRAKTFYELAQLWSPPYVSVSANTTISIPLRLEPDITIPSVRSTLATTYNQITQDLQLCKNLLPTTPVYKTRAGKPACFALLARVFLSMEQYMDARLTADSCLNLYNTLMDYNYGLFSTGSPFLPFNAEVLFYCSLSSTALTLYGFIDTTIVNQYDINDWRKTLFFTANSGPSYTFKGTYTGSNLLFGGLATDEVYLIKAECLAREGQKDSAMNVLNALLTTRYKTGTFQQLTAVDADAALAVILKERNKELLRRGTRWTDLRRLNKDPRFAVTVTRTVNGITYTLPPNSFRYTLPIPDDIIAQTGMQQNAGW